MNKIDALTEKYLLRIFRYLTFVEQGLNTPEDLIRFIKTMRDDFYEERINLLEEIVNA